eukprot:12329403-Alexandrium_andersonii.AAC.1
MERRRSRSTKCPAVSCDFLQFRVVSCGVLRSSPQGCATPLDPRVGTNERRSGFWPSGCVRLTWLEPPEGSTKGSAP